MSGQGRVLDAFHEHGPSQWRPLYERYADFVDAYLVQVGCIDAIATTRDDARRRAARADVGLGSSNGNAPRAGADR